MPDVVVTERTNGGTVGGGFAHHDLGGDEGRGGEDHLPTAPWNTAQVGLWGLLGTLSMLFAGFTSAYVVRRGGADWQPIPLPTILWFNSAVLLASSITMEVARACMRRSRLNALRGWLLVTALLGVVFLMGQLFAWRQLAARGVFLSTNPHSSFFFMLTGVHGAHVLGGLGVLAYALSHAWRRWNHGGPNTLTLCAAYWHFVDGVWIYLFLLMFVS